MKTRIIKSDYILTLFAGIGLLLFLFWFHGLVPHGGVRLDLTKNQIVNIANKFVKDLGLSVSGYTQKIRFQQNEDQITYLVRNYGIQQAQKYMAGDVPVYYWRINWSKPKDLLNELKGSEDEEVTFNIGDNDFENFLSDINLSLSTKGNILEFDAKLSQEAAYDTISQDSAFTIATAILNKIEDSDFSQYIFQNCTGDSNYTFRWKRDSLIYGEKVDIEIQTNGAQIVFFKKNYIPPEDLLNIPDKTNILHIPGILIFLLFFITILIVLIQKLRKDEVGIQSGIGLSIVIGLAFIINFISMSHQEDLLEILIPILIAPTFLVFTLLAIIASSESLSREIWPEKLLSFDALNKLKIFNPPTSKSVFHGIKLGFIALGIATLVLKISSIFGGLYFSIGERNLTSYVLFVPAVSILLSTLTKTCFSEFVFRVFAISYLRKRLQGNYLLLIISACLWAFNFMGNDKLVLLPIYIHLIRNFLIGLLFAYFFIRFDVLTILIGSLVFNLALESYPMFYWGNSYQVWNGALIWSYVGILAVIAIIGIRRKFDKEQLYKYVPPYVTRMQERERMKRELEIARKVQLSFLPKEIPDIPRLNIATTCIPATEVGGDYFDFIRLGDGKLGIVIGDVSGKGISAAFHMTLTKGFLKSQAKDALSPRNVLTRLNELFYENVERGTFISMIYGIFDIKEKSFVFARAGHNPVIIRSSAFDNIEDLCPRGIALGLERGTIFNEIIEEQKIGIRTGDIFIFYTDGVSEAMNQEKSEFGEKRLHSIIKTYSHVMAEDLINIIQKRINEFVGNTPQHDDLTMIIVKIL